MATLTASSEQEPSVGNARRYCLGKRLQAKELEDWPLMSFWKGEQERKPGTALPATFPARSKLADIGYTAVEDLDGATEQELAEHGLSRSDARAVISAIEDLL